MDDLAVPADLATALLHAGYRIGGPAGVGGGGPVWTAVRVAPGVSGPPDPRDRVVVQTVTVPGGDAGQGVVARLEALWALEHPHLARVVDVLPLDRGARAGSGTAGSGTAGRGTAGFGTSGRPTSWAVLLAEVPGATVAALLAARGRLSAGEVVTLTVPIAGALDALHRAGLVHGDVSPANVVVRPDGRPVLIDLLGAVEAGDGRPRRGGTPGFTAPELTRGRRPGGAGTTVAARAAPGRDPQPSGGVGPAEPSGGVGLAEPAGGAGWAEPAGAGPADEPPVALPTDAPADVFSLAGVALAALDLALADSRLGQELRAACSPVPVHRPTAAELAAACFTAAQPEPILLPDAGVLARTALAQLATQPRTVSAGRRSRHRAGGHRGRRRRRVLLGGSAAAALVAAVVVGVVGHGVPSPSLTGGAEASGVVVVVAERPDPVDAAVALTRRRAEVLAGGDPTRVVEVARAGSRAHAADVALLDGLAGARVRLDGLTATVERATAVGDAVDPRTIGAPEALLVDAPVAVRVHAGLSAHRRVSPDGVVEVPAEPVRAVVLRLVWTSDGWRVEDVAPG